MILDKRKPPRVARARRHTASVKSSQLTTHVSTKTRDPREPQQARSRRSLDRLIEAATEILAEDGIQGLTLTEVSRRSEVSIGSLYGRLDGKQALIRAVQAKTLATMQQEFTTLVADIRTNQVSLADRVPAVVHGLAQFLRRHARLLTAFMHVAMTDPLVAKAGRKAHFQDLTGLKQLLLERRGEIRHPDPERAVDTCVTVVYGALARHLGLAPQSDSTGEGNWEQLLVDLGLMSLAFLWLQMPQSAIRRI